MAVAGRVAIVPRDDYDVSSLYKKLDLVRYNHNAYVAKKENTGIEPTNEEYWMLIVENASTADLTDLKKKLESILNGTTPVGNAALHEGLTAKEVGESGARNLIPYPYHQSTVTSNGITFTDNGGTITASGTATANAFFNFVYKSENKMLAPVGSKITFSGMPTTDGMLLALLFVDSSGATISTHYATESGITITVPSGTVGFYIYAYVARGKTISNVVIKPMLEIGSVAHDFVPYHFGGAEDALNADTVDGFHAYEVQPYHKVNNKPYSDITARLEWNSDSQKFEWKANKSDGQSFGVDADTVDGLHASDFLKNTGGTATGTIGSNTGFSRHISNYEAGVIPSADVWSRGLGFYDKNGTPLGMLQHAIYSSGRSVTRLVASQMIDGEMKDSVLSVDYAANGEAFATAPTPINPKDNDSKIATTKWVNRFAVPLDGSVPMSGALGFSGDLGEIYANLASAVLKSRQVVGDDSNYRALAVLNSKAHSLKTAIQLQDCAAGTLTTYKVFHAGNSSAIIKSETAPSDTTAVWVDTKNKKTKVYIDGAWTVMA